MNRGRLIDQCKRLIAEAYEEATEMIVAYLEAHPKEARETLCREIDPENYSALSKRVERLQQKRRSEGVSASTSAGPALNQRATIRSAKSAIRQHPELAAELLKDPAVVRAVIADQRTNTSLAKARQEYDQEIQAEAESAHPALRHARINSEQTAAEHDLIGVGRLFDAIADKADGWRKIQDGVIEAAQVAQVKAGHLVTRLTGEFDRAADALLRKGN